MGAPFCHPVIVVEIFERFQYSGDIFQRGIENLYVNDIFFTVFRKFFCLEEK